MSNRPSDKTSSLLSKPQTTDLQSSSKIMPFGWNCPITWKLRHNTMISACSAEHIAVNGLAPNRRRFPMRSWRTNPNSVPVGEKEASVFNFKNPASGRLHNTIANSGHPYCSSVWGEKILVLSKRRNSLVNNVLWVSVSTCKN